MEKQTRIFTELSQSRQKKKSPNGFRAEEGGGNVKFRIQNEELRIVSRETFVRRDLMFRPDRFLFARLCLHVCLNLNMCARKHEIADSRMRVPVPNARLKRRRRPQTCLRMFQLHEQRPREDRGMQDRISIQVRAVHLCHTAKGPSGGAFGLRWSLPAPVPRRDINSERRSLSFLKYLP